MKVIFQVLNLVETSLHTTSVALWLKRVWTLMQNKEDPLVSSIFACKKQWMLSCNGCCIYKYNVMYAKLTLHVLKSHF